MDDAKREQITAELGSDDSLRAIAERLGMPRSTLRRAIDNDEKLKEADETRKARTKTLASVKGTKLPKKSKIALTNSVKVPGVINPVDLKSPERIAKQHGVDLKKFRIKDVTIARAQAGTLDKPYVSDKINLKIEAKPPEPVKPGPPVVIKGRPRKRSARVDSKLVCVASDFHIPLHDQKLFEFFLEFLSLAQPERLIINGDWLNFDDLSRHAVQGIPKDPTTAQDDINQGTIMLGQVRAALPRDTEITYIEGNHDKWLERYDIQEAPKSAALKRGTLPGQEPDKYAAHAIPFLLHCEELRVDYVDAYPHGNVALNKKLGVYHGDKSRKGGGNTAHSSLERKDHGVIIGHDHRLASVGSTIFSADGTPYTYNAAQSGCMCDLKPHYMKDPDWQNGFLTVTLEDGTDFYHIEEARYQGEVLRWRNERWQ